MGKSEAYTLRNEGVRAPPPPTRATNVLPPQGSERFFSVDIISGFHHRLEHDPEIFMTYFVFLEFFHVGPQFTKKMIPKNLTP